MEPTKLLEKQHRAVEKLFKRAEKAEDPAERGELLREISAQLEQHTRLEEEVFYPAVRELGTEKSEHMVLEAYEEHHVVKTMLRELADVDPDDERFPAKLIVLKELVRHHVEEEEEEMFKLARKLGKEDLAALGEQMAESAGEAGVGAGRAAPRRRRSA